MAGPKKSGFRGGGGGAFKKGYSKKRAGSDEEDGAPRASKKSKGDESENSTPFVPKLEANDDGDSFVALNQSGKRRVTISTFKGNTLVGIREYYNNDKGELKPGSKGISLTLDQYNALLTAAPLLESVLAKRDIEVSRPDYNADLSAAADDSKAASDNESEPEQTNDKADDDEDEE